MELSGKHFQVSGTRACYILPSSAITHLVSGQDSQVVQGALQRGLHGGVASHAVHNPAPPNHTIETTTGANIRTRPTTMVQVIRSIPMKTPSARADQRSRPVARSSS